LAEKGQKDSPPSTMDKKKDRLLEGRDDDDDGEDE
jgi:hypothetical protein